MLALRCACLVAVTNGRLAVDQGGALDKRGVEPPPRLGPKTNALPDGSRGRAAILLYGLSYGLGTLPDMHGKVRGQYVSDKYWDCNTSRAFRRTHRYWNRLTCDRAAYAAVDFRQSVPNYEDYIFSPLRRSGFSIDTFFSTNDVVPQIMRQELLDTYKPVAFQFGLPEEDESANASSSLATVEAEHHNHHKHRKEEGSNTPQKEQFGLPEEEQEGANTLQSMAIPEEAEDMWSMTRWRRIRHVVSMCSSHQRKLGFVYDRVIVLRFDLRFENNFTLSNVDWSKINVITRLQHKYIDDNFYALNGSKIADLKSMFSSPRLRTTPRGDGHELKRQFQDYLGQIHYIWDEDVRDYVIRPFSSFKIVRGCVVQSSGCWVDTTAIPECSETCEERCLTKYFGDLSYLKSGATTGSTTPKGNLRSFRAASEVNQGYLLPFRWTNCTKNQTRKLSF